MSPATAHRLHHRDSFNQEIEYRHPARFQHHSTPEVLPQAHICKRLRTCQMTYPHLGLRATVKDSASLASTCSAEMVASLAGLACTATSTMPGQRKSDHQSWSDKSAKNLPTRYFETLRHQPIQREGS
mmetsp:Transcript_13746/g.30421  ORF Transcript_13746/g.30421 Transcript_13746/m.30421 type:complete len:128 (-) Transcript_13746:194-577(-)